MLFLLHQKNKKLDKKLRQKAYKRALSRANTYNKLFTKNTISYHFIIYLLSKLVFPKNYIELMYRSLKVFNANEIHRPKEWKTGSDKAAVSKKYIR